MTRYVGRDVRSFRLRGIEDLERFLLEIRYLKWGGEADRRCGFSLFRETCVLFVMVLDRESFEDFLVVVEFRESSSVVADDRRDPGCCVRVNPQSIDRRDIERTFQGPTFAEAGYFDFLPK